MTERPLALDSGHRDNDLVFATPDSTLLDHESVAKVFDRRVARSGLPQAPV